MTTPELPDRAEVLAVEAWRRSSPEDELRFLKWKKDRATPGHVSEWMGDGSIRPSDLYCYLKARFGPARGLMMLFRAPSSDNLVHWHFHVSIREGRFEAMSSNRGTELRITAAIPLVDDDWVELILALKRDFRRVHPEMKNVRDSLESWVLFVNPYARLNRIVGEHYDELLPLEGMGSPPKLPRDVAFTEEQLRTFYAELGGWTEKLKQVTEHALVLDMLTPVLAESLVNLIIFTLANDDLRRDPRLYQARLRDQVDVRLRGLHQMCRGFETRVDPESEVFKAFQRIMSRRNDVLHGNVDPTAQQFDTVFFEGTIPIFKEEDLLATRMPRLSMAALNPSRVLDDVEWVGALVLHIWSCLDDQHRNYLEAVLVKTHLGWREDTRRVGVLFSDGIVIGLPGRGSAP